MTNQPNQPTTTAPATKAPALKDLIARRDSATTAGVKAAATKAIRTHYPSAPEAAGITGGKYPVEAVQKARKESKDLAEMVLKLGGKDLPVGKVAGLKARISALVRDGHVPPFKV